MKTSKKTLVSFVITCSVIFSIFSLTTFASDSDKLCSITLGKSEYCSNVMTIQTSTVYYKNTMEDYVKATDAYHLNFIMTTWKPDVTRGDPIYKTYWVTDNFNNELLFTDNSHYGYHLTDYTTLTTGINKTAGYYPQDYGRPVSALETQNMPPNTCSISTGVICRTYTQANQLSVKNSSLAAKDSLANNLMSTSESLSTKFALENTNLSKKQPTKLPFTVDETYAQSSTIGNHNILEITYVNNETKDYLTLRTVDAQITPISSNFTIKQGKLDNSIVSNYLDNGLTQILDWKQDGYSFTIFASSHNKTFSQTELEDIAKSLQ
ncbi:hypothetical protein [Paenibacillus sp. FSL K6-2441]|uniref:hypothetical protein n=2 Tax=Paenibacillus TaxID=44249 RepID=UPI0030D9FF09